MKIMFVINSFNLGGAEKLVYDLAPRMKNKNDIIVVSLKAVETDLEKQNSKRLLNQNIKCIALSKGKRKDRLQTVLSLRKIIKKEKVDIIHTNGLSPNFYSALSKLFLKTKQIAVLHSTTGYKRSTELILQHLVDAYVAVSKDTKKYAIRSLGIKKKIIVIENGIDFERYEINNMKETKDFVLLSVGRVNQVKGYYELLEKISDFIIESPNTKWYIVGDYSSDDPYYRRFVQKATEFKVKDRIIFTGAITNPESYYAISDCYLLNSTFEGFGISFIEAMAAKRIVFANRVGVINDIVNNGGACLPIDDNVCDELRKLQDDPLRYGAEIEKNYSIVKEHYSLESTLEKYNQLIGELLHERKKS